MVLLLMVVLGRLMVFVRRSQRVRRVSLKWNVLLGLLYLRQQLAGIRQFSPEVQRNRVCVGEAFEQIGSLIDELVDFGYKLEQIARLYDLENRQIDSTL